MYFRSFLAKETLITMADSSTKPIEELVEGDKIQTYNQNSKNYCSKCGNKLNTNDKYCSTCGGKR